MESIISAILAGAVTLIGVLIAAYPFWKSR